jgi:hypothetical protein
VWLNEDEFQMFGVSKREHDDRYDESYGGRSSSIWAARRLRLRRTTTSGLSKGCRHRTLANDRRMNAAAPTGRAFAIRHADCISTASVRRKTASTD